MPGRPFGSARVFGSCVLLLAASTSGRAAVHHVPTQYPTLQAGIGACSPGDTVRVAPGTYAGPGNRDLDFGGVDLVLLSEEGANQTVIDAGGSPHGFHRGLFLHTGESRASVIRGFTIQAGLVPVGGGGIYCDGASPTITECMVTGNTVSEEGEDGGGILLRNSSALIQACEITNNQASYGGGIACRGSGSPEIVSCRIEGNRAGHGGGVDAGGVGAPAIRRCRLAGNTAAGALTGPSSGGGLVLGGAAVAEECVISGNIAAFGGGIACWSGTPAVLGCTVAGNDAGDGDGGGVAIRNAATTVEQTVIWGNCAGFGPGLLAGGAGTGSLSCCLFDSLSVDGGALQQPGPNLQEDPLFCDPFLCLGAPVPDGDYRVDIASPCRPEGNPCGVWIGAEVIGCPPASTDEPGGSPDTGVRLGPPCPNPSFGVVRFAIELDRETPVRIEVFDLLGRRIARLLNRTLPPGAHEVAWEDETPRTWLRETGGVYYVRLEAPGVRLSRSIVILPGSPNGRR